MWLPWAEEDKPLNLLPNSGEARGQSLNFICDGKVTNNVGKYFFMCANHFATDCFTNLDSKMQQEWPLAFFWLRDWYVYYDV